MPEASHVVRVTNALLLQHLIDLQDEQGRNYKDLQGEVRRLANLEHSHGETLAALASDVLHLKEDMKESRGFKNGRGRHDSTGGGDIQPGVISAVLNFVMGIVSWLRP